MLEKRYKKVENDIGVSFGPKGQKHPNIYLTFCEVTIALYTSG